MRPRFGDTEGGHSADSVRVEIRGNFQCHVVGFVARADQGDLEETLGADQAADRCYTRERQVEGGRCFIANRSQRETLHLHSKAAAIAVVGDLDTAILERTALQRKVAFYRSRSIPAW